MLRKKGYINISHDTSSGISGVIYWSHNLLPSARARISLFKKSVLKNYRIAHLEVSDRGEFEISGTENGEYIITVHAEDENGAHINRHARLRVYPNLISPVAIPLSKNRYRDVSGTFDIMDILKLQERSNPFASNLLLIKKFIYERPSQPCNDKEWYEHLKKNNLLPLLISPKDALIITHSKSPVMIRGDFNNWEYASPLVKMPRSDVWIYWIKVSEDTLLQYKLVKTPGEYVCDEANPLVNTADDMGRGNSILKMPRAQWHVTYKPAIAHGKICTFSFTNEMYRYSKKIHVYLPPGYCETARPYKTVYLNDGRMFMNNYIIHVLDNWIASGLIPELVFVLIEESYHYRELEFVPLQYYPLRMRETAEKSLKVKIARGIVPGWYGELYKVYGETIRNSIIPCVEKNFNLSKDRKDRAILGHSFGAVVSLYLADTYPECFRNIGIQSWSGMGALSNTIYPYRLYIGEGVWELAGGILWGIGSNCKITNKNEFKKYTRHLFGKNTVYVIDVYSGGHSPFSWYTVIPKMIRFFWR
ncbi:MAG: alpha/beta hydrolase-fold protein [Candidatus Omnitrophota bacterium]